MKKILTSTDNKIYGPFNTVTQNDVGYVCDNVVYQTNLTGTVTVSEVAADYVNPVVFNEQQRENRANAYPKVGEQLDMLWHAIDSGTLDKTSTFYTTLKQVKDTYPKV